MRYKKFGKTGLEVSEICLGTWGIGGAGWDAHSDEERMDAIKAALDCGINFIDTAQHRRIMQEERSNISARHCIVWGPGNMLFSRQSAAINMWTVNISAAARKH